MAVKDDDKDLKAEVTELSENVAKLTKLVTATLNRDEDADDERADFAEAVDDQVTEVQEVMKFGAEFAEKLGKVGRAMYGNKKGQRAFKGLLDGLAKVKFAPAGRLLDGDEEGDGAELNEKDFIDAAGGSKDETIAVAARTKIQRVLDLKKKKDPKLTFTDLRRQVVAK